MRPGAGRGGRRAASGCARQRVAGANLRLSARKLFRRYRRFGPLAVSVLAVLGFWLLEATAGDRLWRAALPAPTPGYIRPIPTPAPIDWALVRGEAPVTVWASQSGSKYHSDPACSGMKSPDALPLMTAQARGLLPCSRCWP